jgi:RimJ/RimL family protein N-acetyltransferase
VVARREGQVVGYALSMDLACGPLVPALEVMFATFERLRFDDRPLTSYRFYVMGQVCVAREVRGAGVFDALYAGHRRWFADRFELLVTDVASRNHRSRRAHARVGFVDLHRYRDADDDWVTVALPLAR